MERVAIFAKNWETANNTLMETFRGHREDALYFKQGMFATDKIEFYAYEVNEGLRCRAFDVIWVDENLSIKDLEFIKNFRKNKDTSLIPF